MQTNAILIWYQVHAYLCVHYNLLTFSCYCNNANLLHKVHGGGGGGDGDGGGGGTGIIYTGLRILVLRALK